MVSLEGGETVLADEVYLRESILAPMAKIVSGYNPIMPDFRQRITDEQVEVLIEYIRALRK
jgi:cytochrome c oxidase subunit 2